MFPRTYTNIDKKTFLETNISNKACIVFYTDSKYENDYEKYPDHYFPNIRSKAINESKDYLFIKAEDVGLNWGHENTPTMEQLGRIVSFLEKNKDNEILSVCDAGIARSGFVTFLLDVYNRSLPYLELFTGYEDNDFAFRPVNSATRNYFTCEGFTRLLFDSRYLDKEDISYIKSKITNIEKGKEPEEFIWD